MGDVKAFQDHYATLGVPPTASSKEIRSARNRLLKQHHPDFHSKLDPQSKEKTIAILLAAKVLLDGNARREYDRTYRYVHGPARTTTSSGTTGTDTAREGVTCAGCDRRNSWERRYCIYCGAGFGDSPPGVHVDDVFFEEVSRRDRVSTFLHFGCGALLGFLVVGAYGGFRMFGALKIESGLMLLVVTLVGSIAFGVASVALRDRFLQAALKHFYIAPLSMLGILLIARIVRGLGENDNALLAVLGVLLFLCCGLVVLRDRVRSVVSKLLGRVR